MIIPFTKYHGTGNDFIMIDATKDESFSLSDNQIQSLCDRRFGIGADGVIIILKHKDLDFEMRYHNADGSMSFCGNGARCAVKFASTLGLFEQNAQFLAIDGQHEATIEDEVVSLRMNDVRELSCVNDQYVIDTGSPHFIEFTKELESKDIVQFGKEIRYSATYKEKGINVNLVEITGKNKMSMLTYERGVEDETYSCGTGATAVALAYADKENLSNIDVHITVKGGFLKVKAKKTGDVYTDVFLIGPAVNVFTGSIAIDE